MIQRWWFTPPVWGRLTSASGLIPGMYRMIANWSDQSAWSASCLIGRHFMSLKKKKKKEEATWWELTLGAQWLLFSSRVPKGKNNPFRVEKQPRLQCWNCCTNKERGASAAQKRCCWSPFRGPAAALPKIISHLYAKNSDVGSFSSQLLFCAPGKLKGHEETIGQWGQEAAWSSFLLL